MAAFARNTPLQLAAFVLATAAATAVLVAAGLAEEPGPQPRETCLFCVRAAP